MKNKDIILPDFDTLKKMHQDDPESLNQLQKELTSRTIAASPKEYQAKLKGIQFYIDHERVKYKPPYVYAGIVLQNALNSSLMMFSESVKVSDSCERLSSILSGNEPQPALNPPLETVPFVEFEKGEGAASKCDSQMNKKPLELRVVGYPAANDEGEKDPVNQE